MAISAGGYMLGAMLGQMLWGGVSAGMDVSSMLDQNKAACKRNEALQTSLAEILSAFEEGATSAIAEDKLRSAIHTWEDSLADLHYWAVVSRQRFHKHFVIFLVGLAIVTILLFFAVEKKAGRLDKLFQKIGRISDALDKGSGDQGAGDFSA